MREKKRNLCTMNAELEALLAQLENVSTDEDTPSPSPNSTPNASPRVLLSPAQVKPGPNPSIQRQGPTSTRRDEEEELGALLSQFKGNVQPTSNHSTDRAQATGGNESWEGRGVYRSPYEEEFLRAQQAANDELAQREKERKERLDRIATEKAARTVDSAAGCGGCGQSVSGAFLRAVGREWHTACFVCQGCKEPLTGPTARGGGKFFELGGRPYCDTCYRRTAKQK